MVERGVIQHRDRKQQIANMSGLRYGNITPTDLDAFIDFGDRLFVFIEGKFLGTPVLRGQMIAIERLCDACHVPPRRFAFAVIADHYSPSDEDIDFANMTVRSIRQNGKWNQPMQKGLTLKDAVDRMKSFVDNKTRNRNGGS